MVSLKALINSGINQDQSQTDKRCIYLTNQISLILIGFSLILFGTYYYWYGWNFVTICVLVVTVIFLCPIILNYRHYFTLSRLWVSLSIPVIAMGVSIYSKILYQDNLQELDYFTFRFLILASCVFPFILFTLKELKLLFACALVGLTILMAHDPLHNLFNVGYVQIKLTSLNTSSYYFTNVVVFLTYCIMVGAVIFLKWISENTELKNTQLIDSLNQTNEELVEKNAEIEAQSMTLMSQREVLNTNQQKLVEAYAEIESHKNYLSKENKNLAAELIDKNRDLTETNSELIKYNNELRQFSYTVSHNLRGPVASLMGLVGLIDLNQLKENRTEIIDHLKSSVVQLDSIIHDLSKIIDIRHDIFNIRQKIDLEKEIEDIKLMLGREIAQHHVTINYDLGKCRFIYSVKPMVHSILYNLISNSIKYRSFDRQLEINILALESAENIVISIKDNGIGIDLASHSENIFKLYKRFNYNTEGKGLGLYLVKLQCDALGGKINVESELNKFTTFTVWLRKPDNIQMQILYEKPYATIFFDAKMNATGVKWYGPVTSDQYRKVFNKCLEFLLAYHTPNWVSDMSEQGVIQVEDQQWMFKNILPVAAANGLKRIAGVRPDAANPKVIEYVKGIRATIAALNLEQSYFEKFEYAFDWLMSENEKAGTAQDAF